MDSFDALAARPGVREVHEIGCGEGHISSRLARTGFRVRACDVSVALIAEAREAHGELGIEFETKSIYDLTRAADSAPLIVCCEVLEHLEQPEVALDRLADIATDWCLMSVPREPIWRALNFARGKYLADLGNTPGHLQHWSKAAFLRFVERRFDIVECRSPLPWTMVLCRARPPMAGV